MAKKLTPSLSTPLVVDTQFGALSTNFWIESIGDQPLDQFYDESLTGDARWNPNRVSAGSLLRLKAHLSIGDPDGILPSEAASFKSINWFEVTETNGTLSAKTNVLDIQDSVVIGGQTVRVYTVDSAGVLTCRRNVAYTTSYKLICEAVYTDTRNGEDKSYTEFVMLTTSKTNDPAYMIRHDTPREVRYRPLTNEVNNGAVVVGNVTFGATLLKGDTEVLTAKYFWYWSDENNTEVLFGDANTPCAAYVSGQGGKVLTLNPDKVANLTITVKVATTTSATQPNVSTRETFALYTIYDEVSADTISKNGSSLRPSHQSMTFEAQVKVNKKDMPDVIRNEYIRMNWKYKKVSARALTDAGWGLSATIQRANLITTTGDNTIVFPELYILGPDDYLTDDSPGGSGLVTDDSPGGSGYVTGRV